MAIKLQHISPDELLVHPGETILEIIQERNISQKELAIRTGFTEKHISTVLHGQKNISSEFAMKLEYALSIPASFWRNLQTNYDLEVISFNEMHSISDEEKHIAQALKQPVEILTGKIIKSKNGSDTVYQLRQLLGFSNLSSISSLNTAFYRAQFAKNTSEHIMYVWQYLCEKEVEGQTDNPLDVSKLKQNIPSLKAIMHQDASKHVDLIKHILNDCGILFTVAKHVEKAPIKGLTVKTKKNQVMIALTIRGKFIDIFWFTLFHEIAHVIYGDYLENQSDWLEHSDIESRADQFAKDTLINPLLYHAFLSHNDFSLSSIEAFAMENHIIPSIVIGRLMKDEKLPWTFSHLRETYTWSDDV